MQVGTDIGGRDIAIVDPEAEDEHDLGDEQQSEEEGEAPQRFLPMAFEGRVIESIDERAQKVERRQHDDASQNRIEADPRIEQIGEIGSEDDEGGMRDIDDVEDAERDRHPKRHRGIETAQQQARHQGVDQEIGR